MSELQIALLLIGGAVVLAVLVFNWVQERRFRKQAAKAFQAPERDALLETPAPRERARVEPGFTEPVFDGIDDVQGLDEPSHPRIDLGDIAPTRPQPAGPTLQPAGPTLRPAAPAAKAPVSPPPPPKAAVEAVAAPIDELIEYRIRIVGDGILASVFADAMNRTRSLGKAVRWLGLPVGATAWQEVQPWRELHLQEVDIAVQLADRNGAVEESTLADVCALAKSIAQQHGLRFACDDVAEAVERAQAIDRFCVDVDVLIGLNIVARSGGTLNPARILAEAQNAGMVRAADGSLALRDSRGEVLYTLSTHDGEAFDGDAAREGVAGVTLQFDVPRVPDGVRIFDDMVAFGRKLANEAGGLLVDDNMKPLTDTGIAKIRQQLASIYERMEARGVPPGSRRALRLFS
jgi:hypothetical protein